MVRSWQERDNCGDLCLSFFIVFTTAAISVSIYNMYHYVMKILPKILLTLQLFYIYNTIFFLYFFAGFQ